MTKKVGFVFFFLYFIIFFSKIASTKRNSLEASILLLFRGFPGGSDGKESACNAGDPGLILGLGRSPGGGCGNPPVFLPGEPPWTEEPGRLQSMGSQRVGHS